MKRKIFDQYLFKGLGFPVLLLNVPMVQFEGDWAPDVDYETLEKCILLLLCQKHSRLKGDEVHYIRTYFSYTLQSFGDIFGISPAGVKKWEDCEDQFTSMGEASEKLLRLFVLDQLLPAAVKKNDIIEYRKKIKYLIEHHFDNHATDIISIDTSQMDDRIAI
jgi:DNA-binding transcriptional regulator YiaG